MSSLIFWTGLAGIFSLAFFVISALTYGILSIFVEEVNRPNFVAATVFGLPLQLAVSWVVAEFLSQGFDMAFGGAGLVMYSGLIAGTLLGVLLVLIAFITRRYANK